MVRFLRVNSFRRTRDSFIARVAVIVLLVWLLQVVQTLSQVARVSSSRLPVLLRATFRAVALIQLQGIVLPPACTGVFAFQQEVIVIGIGMLTALITIACYAIGRGRLVKLRKLGGITLTASLMLLPMATEAAVGLLSCSSVSMKASSVGALDGGAAVQAGLTPRDVVQVRLLDADPYFVCWAGRWVLLPL